MSSVVPSASSALEAKLDLVRHHAERAGAVGEAIAALAQE